MNPIAYLWALAIALIALAGLFAGLGFAIWRGAQDDFREWLRDSVVWCWTRYGAQIRWGIAGAIALTILKLA